MTAQEYLLRPLIQIRCIHVQANGKRCMHWVGDMVSGIHTVQNFRCADCNIEWLVEKDKTDAVIFIRVPKNTKKNYRKDTGFRVEIHQERLSIVEPALSPGA
jgi:hypothetical protein